MPKVTEEYIHNKKNKIVEAAYTLCLEKTVSTVTMQDIIDKTGLSQGGIYRFYKDIDAIFCDMLISLREKGSIKERVDDILMQPDQRQPKEVVNRLFGLLADFLQRELMGIEKIDFELTVLAMNDPARVDKILKNVSGVGNMEYLTMRTTAYFTEQIRSGRIHPRVKTEELLSFISSAYTGIQTTCMVHNCYQHERNPLSDFYQPDIQLKTLAKTVCYLIGEE